MVRQLYIFILLAHPWEFKYRYGQEMLAIFDEAAAQGDSTLSFLADGLWSLVRYWGSPHQPVKAAAASDTAGAPMFSVLDTSVPSRRHMMTGVTLTLVLFSGLTIAMGRDERSPGIIIGTLHSTRPGLLGVKRSSIEPAGLTTEVRVRPVPLRQARAVWFTTPIPVVTFGILDYEGDLVLSPDEIANAMIMLQKLDLDRDGRVNLSESSLLLTIFDRDRNGSLTTNERRRAPEVLRRLDANNDGKLTLEEAMPTVVAAL